MKIIFTEEDGDTHTQARYLRGGLLKNFHLVKTIRDFQNIPSADIWFHGLYYKTEFPFPDAVRRGMERFSGRVVFFQNDDRFEVAIEKIPPHILNRAVLVLRNIWPADENGVNSKIRHKTGLMNPYLRPYPAIAGKTLDRRSIGVNFFGAQTGDPVYSRAFALQLLKKNGIGFSGGLFATEQFPSPPEDFRIPMLSRKEYMRTLSDSRISLCLYGFNPLTFRFFESFSRRCLVIAQDLGGIRYADCGLRPGVHFAAVRKDLSDLADTVRYYLAHPDEAQSIADAGFACFKANFAFSGVNMPQPLYRQIVGSWKGLHIPDGRPTPRKLIVRALLPLIHSL